MARDSKAHALEVPDPRKVDWPLPQDADAELDRPDPLIATAAEGIQRSLAELPESAATGFISDPANDQPVRLDPGTQPVSRPFVLPPDLPSGNFDVLVSLYLDIDNNGAINSGDLALRLERYDGALSVNAAGDGLFGNGFE